MQLPETRSTYIKAIALHALGALIAAGMMGVLLGVVGHEALGWVPGFAPWAGLGVAAALLLLREIGLLTYPIPEMPRQTEGHWYRERGPIEAAWWWGLDLGSGATTFVPFSAYWLVVAGALVARDVPTSIIAMSAYGLGRSLSVAIPIVFLGRASALQPLYQDLSTRREPFVIAHALGIAWFCVLCIVRVVSTS